MDDFARFFDNSLDLNGIASAEGYFRRVNAGWERTLGWTAAEISASPWLELVHPDEVAATRAKIEGLRRGVASSHFENRYRCKDGSYRWLRWSASADYGGLIYFAAHDVTMHKRAEEALRISEQEFRLLAESMPQIVWATRADGWNIYFNQQWVDYTGLTLEESYGHGWNTPFHPDDQSRAWEAWQAATAAGGIYSLECRLRRADGAYLWWLIRGVPVRDANGAIVKWVGTCTDIDAMKQAEQKVLEERSSLEFRALVDNLPELAWTARPDGFIEFYNRRWYDYTGTCYEDMQGWGWQSVHDPAELPRVMESWTQSIATGQPFDQVFPLRRKDGVFRWFLTRVAPIFDDAGELIRWVGINTDIDDQRRDQEALREAEQRFRLAIEASPTGMLMMDRAGKIVLVNVLIEKLFGYPREELLGQGIEMLVPERFRARHPDFRRTFFGDPRARAMGGGRELYGLRRDGTEVPIEIGLNPLKTSEGDLVLSSVVDITERKIADGEREDLLGQLRALNAELEERVRERTSELSATLKEREVLLQEIHHRVKNNLQVISSLINMQVRQLKDASSRDALEECQTRVQAIALIHEKLYQSKDYARVPFSEYVKGLAESVFRAMGVSANTVVLDLRVEDLALAVDKAIPCGLILNELISNALKHAFPTATRGIVRVELRRSGDREIVLSVIDDGIGMPADFDPAKSNSLGVQLVLTLVEQIDGRLDIVRKEGTTFRLTFPLETAS